MNAKSIRREQKEEKEGKKDNHADGGANGVSLIMKNFSMKRTKIEQRNRCSIELIQKCLSFSLGKMT